MNAPEDTTKKEWLGPEATARDKELVAGKTVTLVKDVSETDKYGRLLRFVFVDNVLVNYELVREGYAKATPFKPDVSCEGLFLRCSVAGAASARRSVEYRRCILRRRSRSRGFMDESTLHLKLYEFHIDGIEGELRELMRPGQRLLYDVDSDSREEMGVLSARQ
jgi:hypothetical protein